MKKSITQVLLLFISFFIHGQSYHPLLIQGNRWNIQYIPHPSEFKCGRISIPDSTGTEILKISADTTIINGIIYKNLISSYDSMATVNSSIGLIREDTVAQKVYFMGGNGYIPWEVLLYDFNVKVKDTISYYIVDSIDSIKIGTRFHKRIQLNNGIIWVEGIGSLDGLITSAMEMPLCGTIYTRTLLCFYNHDSLIYQPNNVTYKDCFYPTIYVGINSLEHKSNFALHPSPAGDNITINSKNDENYFVEVIDIQGKILISKKILNQTDQINLQGIKSGIYFVRITSRQDIFTYKIIKE